MPQTPPKAQTADNGHDRGCNHEEITRYGNAGEKRPSLEYVSEDGACEHPWPESKEVCIEHSKENERPFYFSKDGPPALHKAISKTREEATREHTDIIHGARIWMES